MDRPPRPPLTPLLAVALVAFATLADEVALTRLFSVLFRSLYVFLIVSGAIGGLGLGGLLLQMLALEQRPAAVIDRWITGLTLVLAVLLALPVILLLGLPFGREIIARAEIPLVIAAPLATLAAAGMLISLLLQRYAAHGGLLYQVDLAAAAAAAPVSVVLLDHFGGIDTPLVLAVGCAAGGLVLAWRSRHRTMVVTAAGLLAGLTVALVTDRAAPWLTLPGLKQPPEAVGNPLHPWRLITKPLFAELGDPFNSSKIIRTDWTAVSRTDTVEDHAAGTTFIYTDGDVPTQMDPWDGELASARAEYSRFIGVLPYRLATAPTKSVMAIGAGGGLDVLLARVGGATKIDAVEINPAIPRIIRDPRFAGTYARAYDHPSVRLVVDEGRSFLQRQGRYDLIYFACAKSATTQTSGVALLDNQLYTVEAFREYWRHLTDDGILGLVTQDGVIIDRLLLTALTALAREGVPSAEAYRHFQTARVSPSAFGPTPYRFILTMRRQPFLDAEAPRVRSALAQTDLTPLFAPGIHLKGCEGADLPATGDPEVLRPLVERQYPLGQSSLPADLSAVTDDRPFYADLARGLNPALQGVLWFGLAATIVAVGSAIFFGLGDRADSRPGMLGTVAYFLLLGVGFMLVELALMHRFMLLLGFPTRSLTITLFALLVSGAAGSAFAQRGNEGAAMVRLRRLLPVLILILVLYRLTLAPILDALLPQALPVRALAAVLLLAPAGFFMGMALPTALRCMPTGRRRLIPACWGVNGAASILGSIGAMAIAKFAGYGTALLAGAVVYALAWGIFPLVRLGSGEE